MDIKRKVVIATFNEKHPEIKPEVIIEFLNICEAAYHTVHRLGKGRPFISEIESRCLKGNTPNLLGDHTDLIKDSLNTALPSYKTTMETYIYPRLVARSMAYVPEILKNNIEKMVSIYTHVIEENKEAYETYTNSSLYKIRNDDMDCILWLSFDTYNVDFKKLLGERVMVNSQSKPYTFRVFGYTVIVPMTSPIPKYTKEIFKQRLQTALEKSIEYDIWEKS